jgi:hypothetical protein
MHLFGGTGILMLLPGSLLLFYLFVLKLLGNDIWGRPILMLGMLLIIVGILLIMLGILAELLMRIYYDTGTRKLYNIRDSWRCKDEG